MEIALALPFILRILSHTDLVEVREFILETYSCQEDLFAWRMVLRALARAI